MVDEQFRPALESLAARLRDDIARHVDAALADLTVSAGQHAARVAADHAALTERSVADAVAGQAAATEQQIADAIARQAALSEQHVADVLARLALAQQLTADAEARAAAIAVEGEERAAALVADAERRVAVVAADASDQAAAVAAEHQAALDQAVRIARAEAETIVSERLSASLAAVEAHASASFQAADAAAGERLVHAVRSIDQGASLSDILNTLAAAASADAARVAIFLTEATRYRGWRLTGFGALDAATDYDVDGADAGIVGDAFLTGDTASTASTDATDATDATGPAATGAAPIFAQLPPERTAVAVPLVIGDEVAAVLYADEGPEGDLLRASWPSTIEVLARHAARALEAATAHRLAKMLAERAPATGASRSARV